MRSLGRLLTGLFMAMCCAVLLAGCGKPSFDTPYQAVLLGNGFVYFGKIESLDKSYLLLTDVFYIQTQTSPEGKPVASILVKRGKEWHGPDRMYINASHVLMIEPVAPDSKVAQLIKEEKEKAAGSKK